MNAVKEFKDLTVWQRGMDLVVEVYRLTERFPAVEQFGLTGQLRRAAVSVPANIAEGNGRNTKGEYIHSLSIARGSVTELQTHVLIAARLGYLDNANSERIVQSASELVRMLTGLIRSLRRAASA